MKSTCRYILLVCLSKLLVEAVRDGKNFRCDYTYFPNAEGWIKPHQMKSTWHEARLRCHLEGAVLASPLNPGITAAMKNVSTDNFFTDLHTGIHATYSKRIYSSIEGVPLTKILNQSSLGLPSILNDEEKYLSFYRDGMGLFGSVRSSKRPYMCYKKFNESLVVNKCGTVDNEYSMDPSTLHCYKFHRVARPWDDAYLTCEAEGGYLLIINSKDEALAVRKLMFDNASFLPPVSSTIFSGFTAMDEPNWLALTIHGQSLEEAGYDKFTEESQYTQFHGCGTVNAEGLLAYEDCDLKKHFICEKTPSSLPCEDENSTNANTQGKIDNTLSLDE